MSAITRSFTHQTFRFPVAIKHRVGAKLVGLPLDSSHQSLFRPCCRTGIESCRKDALLLWRQAPLQCLICKECQGLQGGTAADRLPIACFHVLKRCSTTNVAGTTAGLQLNNARLLQKLCSVRPGNRQGPPPRTASAA